MRQLQLSSIKILLLGFILISACADSASPLIGNWENQQGHILIFQEGKTALWIINSESATDTFEMRYSTDLTTDPKQVDLYGFSSGSFHNKTLYGIMEFGDGYFRFDFNEGLHEEVRPQDFDTANALLFFRTRKDE